MLYCVGSNLETDGGLASYNLRQVLALKFSDDEDVRFIVMTGGSHEWQLEQEYLDFGEINVPEDAVTDYDTDKLLDPKSRISNYGVENYPADKYDLILWDHGGGPDGESSGATVSSNAQIGETGAESEKPEFKLDMSKVEIEPLFEELVDFDTFSKSDFRAVKIKNCEEVKKSDKLLKFTLNDGTGDDRIPAGAKLY